ncbi:MAG: N-acetyl-gamma-glutamyl-phosphate reductase [Clostridia bacterium]|nr:N-acetyl-gamma-glutamyl-phosphate reductase [Clostridia bacterium]
MNYVFIDGKEGTTGLQIYDRLESRSDLSLLLLPEELRKDEKSRKECMNEADVVFLCLPDAAAREAVKLVENPHTKIIDASTAHRTNPDWTYGFPELSREQREEIMRSRLVANPGCHASGFIALVYPLIKEGILPPDYPFVCHSVTGYSGGGKKMIAEYESAERSVALDSPRQYGLTLSHKHIPEMMKVCNLTRKPIFNPIVADFYSGMCGSVPVFVDLMKKKMTGEELRAFYRDYYRESAFVSVTDEPLSYLPANKLAGTNQMQLFVGGNEEEILLCSLFDNLGKGASGAAVQNMNLMLGLPETAYLK